MIFFNLPPPLSLDWKLIGTYNLQLNDTETGDTNHLIFLTQPLPPIFQTEPTPCNNSNEKGFKRTFLEQKKDEIGNVVPELLKNIRT